MEYKVSITMYNFKVLPSARNPINAKSRYDGKGTNKEQREWYTSYNITSRASKLDCNVARQRSVRGFYHLSKLILSPREPANGAPSILRPVQLLRRFTLQPRGQRQPGTGFHSLARGVRLHRQYSACRRMVDRVWNGRVRGRTTTA